MKDIEFLKKSAALFQEYGAKTFTMDDIAREFRMSKKTLYQKYKNKETLLEDVLDYLQDNIITIFKNVETQENPVIRMYCRDAKMEEAIETNDSLFIKQLIKYYPDIYEKHCLRMSEKVSEVLYDNIMKGRKEGLYRENFDARLYAKFFFHLMISYHNAAYMGTDEIKKADYCRLVLDFYLNAITTEKGKKFLEKK